MSTHIRQMAPLLYIINFSKLRFRVRNETTLISAKNHVDLSSISEVISYITDWPRFLGVTLYITIFVMVCDCHALLKATYLLTYLDVGYDWG